MEMTVGSLRQKSSLIPMTIIATLFVIFGCVTWLNGFLIPFLKIVCDLNEFQALFVTFAFYIAYTVMALPMSFLLNRLGYKNGMLAGLAIMAVGALLFIPAAKLAAYQLFLLALFTLGTGLTILQTASNPYVVCIGPRESAAMRISIMGILNKAAGIVIPVLFTWWLLHGMDQFSPNVLNSLAADERATRLAQLSNRLVEPYLYMAAILAGLIVFLKLAPLPEPQIDEDAADVSGGKWAIFQFPQLILGAVALFMYVGVEVIAADTIGLYGQSLGLSNFGALTSYTMAFMILGYLVGVFCIPRFISQAQALTASAVLGLVLTLALLFSSSQSESVASLLTFGLVQLPDPVFFLAMLGLANALVWPAIWPLALDGLGKYTATGSALLIMGIAGGAILPLIYGFVSHQSGNPQWSYLVLIPCYLFILFYALKGQKLRRWH